MITLYHSPQSRSSRLVWLLEEIGEPYKIELVTVRRQGGVGESDPKNVHPDKKVPALVHDGNLVTESAAICLYLSDLFPKAKVGPQIGDPDRAAYLTWLAWYAGVLEPALLAKFAGRTDREPEEQRTYDQMSARLRSALTQGPYLLKSGFSSADILVASAFQWARGMMPPGEVFDAYVKRLEERPAFRRAGAKDGSVS
jgi:glutathione S-transferase